MAENSEQSLPRTVGELRRRLSELGNPWSIDPRLGDDDPIPDYPRGGQIPEELPGVIPVEGDLTSFLQHLPPSNPFLRQRWVELGLLPENAPGVPQGSSPPGETVPPPSSEEAL